MAAPQFLPIPNNIHALACEAISRRIGRLPFTRNDVEITEGLIGVTLECLNAEVKRTLPLCAASRDTGFLTGLGECLSERLGSDQGAAAPVIAEVLVSAGLAKPAEVLDAATHTQMRGIRLLSAWTWHIASGDMLPCDGTCSSGGKTDAWLAQCPICRTGILSRVTGKRLFGVPPADYYLDCSHCGAKFIPEKDRFRLVSIAHISDPHWRQYLNSCRKSDDWAALVHEEKPVRPASRIATSRYRMAPKKADIIIPQPVAVHRPVKPARPVEGVPVSFSTLKDGSLVVTGTTKTLYFRPVKLRFLRGVRHDLFSQSQRTVQQALEAPVFADVKPLFVREYLRYLPLRLGPVTEELQKKNDPLFPQLLNRYGDEDFGSFTLQNEDLTHKKGLLIVYVQGKLCHVAGCHSSYADLVDRTFGNITADKCYRDGDETACRINSLVTAFRSIPVIWLHELSDDTAIDAAVFDLRSRYLQVTAASQ
ncbi:MAG: hypothetical protein ABR999_00575 [Methanoregula sp.]|jgi:hypothetical protein|uniref:hypothetical protein n=1 Tax=Methanoregula sp. TaxID=2052170 RepID=UPI003D15097B